MGRFRPNAGGGAKARAARRGGKRGGRGGKRGGRGGGDRGRRGGRGGRGGGRGGRKGQKTPDWKCGSCGEVCFGSKSSCFKCGTAKGGHASGTVGGARQTGGGLDAAALKTVDTVEMSAKSRTIIRDLMGVLGGDGGVAAPSHSAEDMRNGNPATVSALSSMKFKAEDVDSALVACSAEAAAAAETSATTSTGGGGVPQVGVGAALNWLLLNVPEERIPKALGQLSSKVGGGGIEGAGGGGGSSGSSELRAVLTKPPDAGAPASCLPSRVFSAIPNPSLPPELYHKRHLLQSSDAASQQKRSRCHTRTRTRHWTSLVSSPRSAMQSSSPRLGFHSKSLVTR